MADRFSDRLEFATYADEEPLGFALATPDGEPDWDVAVMIPLPLVARLVALAGAYELHHLPMIDLYGETRFNAVQRQGLLDKLEFVATLVQDPALIETVTRIRPLVADPRRSDLVVSGP